MILDGSLTLKSSEVLEINTTAPSINCTPSCNYNASHDRRNSSSGIYHDVAVITFTGDILLMSGSTVKVVGEYALSIISLYGSIKIQTDINMTCRVEPVFNRTCLGGFTQSAAGVSVGLSGSSEKLYKGKDSILISFSVASLLHVISIHDIHDMCYGLLTSQDLACYLIFLTKLKQ